MTKPTWDKFQSAYALRNGVEVKLDDNTTLWRNKFYTVEKKIMQPELGEAGAIWLSIKHNDRRAIRDWRHFQRIKNELAGAEREAVEIFPPESQLVDTANQYHLWVLPEGESTPFTWNQGRMVADSSDDPALLKIVEAAGFTKEDVAKSVQRPYERSE
jgi:hypothetical protein